MTAERAKAESCGFSWSAKPAADKRKSVSRRYRLQLISERFLLAKLARMMNMRCDVGFVVAADSQSIALNLLAGRALPGRLGAHCSPAPSSGEKIERDADGQEICWSTALSLSFSHNNLDIMRASAR